MQVVWIVNVTDASNNVPIFLIYLKHLLRSFLSALNEEVYLKWDLVSFFNVFLYFFDPAR